MKTETSPPHPTVGDLARAVAVLRAGGLVAFPTETVYGLGADASNEQALRRIFAVKGRPETHPLIVHLHDAEALADHAEQPGDIAWALARRFWPGPLSLIVRRHARVSRVATGGLDTVALRVPRHDVARALLSAFGGAIAAPSANLFGSVSPTTAAHVRADLGGEVDFVLDGGPCAVGVESTILDLSTGRPRLLRPGGVTVEALEEFLGEPIEKTAAAGVRAPGMLPSHYAPRAEVVLVNEAELETRAVTLAAQGRRVAVLSAARAPGLSVAIAHIWLPVDPDAAAAGLFSALREADARHYDVVLAVLPEETGLGLAVADRLRKAAGPR